MRRISRWIYRLLAVFAIFASAINSGASFIPAPSAPAAGAAWQSKVDAWVLDTAAQDETEFLLFLTEQADLSGAASLATKAEKGAYVYEQLSRTAARTQAPLLAELERIGAQHRPYWVANMVWVRGDAALVQAMAQRSDVAHIYANPWVQQAPPEPAASQIESTTAIEWNILKVRADQVWAAGYTGQGAVIAGQDTGYDWDHPALKQQYRGWDGAAADHNYSWHDAIHEDMLPYTPPGNPCSFDSPVPCDDHGHGTHTMGTMVGDDGGSNQIGMAPGARWIGCRNMEQGWGSPTTYSECYQWFIAPTDLNGQDPRTDLAPDVINNSWGCTVAEGCSDPNALKTVVENVRAAGILTVSSAGNSGSACSTVNQPAAIYDASFTVGATDSSDLIAGFSSRGPVTVDGSSRLKPDVSAPGVGVRSSLLNNSYGLLSGTSMAAPHAAGLVGLLISAAPHLAGQVDLLESLITGSAVPRTTSQECGTVPGSAVPNNTYGYGRIDALSALNIVIGQMNISKTAQPDTVIPGGLITYTLSISYTGYLEQVHQVVISDTLPAHTSFVSASDGYLLNNGTVRWTFPSVTTSSRHHVRLAVTADSDAAGEISNDLYAARSQETPPTSGSALITPVLSYSLSPDQQSNVTAGSVLTYTHWLTNTSTVSQTFHLELVSSQGWAVFSPGTTIDTSLAAGAAMPVQIRVEVPPDASTGQVEESTLTVSTVSEPVQQRSVTSSTRVMLQLYLPVIQRE